MKFARLKSALPHILSIAALLAFIGYLYQNADQYRQLLNLSTSSLVLLCGLVIAIMLANGLLNYFLYRGLDVPLTLNEGIGLAAVNTLANQLPFAGGLVAKGVYLKRKYVLAYTHFLGATLALYVCFVAANGVLGILVLTYLTFTNDIPISILLLLGFLGMALSALLFWLPYDVGAIPGKWGQRLTQLLAGWQILRRNLPLLGELIGVQLLMTLIFAGRLWIAFHLLSQEVSLAQCMLFAAATILTRLVSITPGALGVREAIVAGIAAILGFDAGVSVVAVGIDRLVATVVIIILGTVYTYILSKQVIKIQDLSP